MKIPSQELLTKFGQAPGHCTYDECVEVSDWLLYLNGHVKAYKAVFGEPAGLSIESHRDKAEWYVRYQIDKKVQNDVA